MNYIIVEFSRYIILGALGLYLIESVWPLFYKKGDTDRGVYVRQLVYICLIHTLSMVTLYLVTDSDGYMRMYVLQIILLFAINRLYVMIYPRCSRMLVNHMCLLITIGFVELSRISYDKAFRQYFIVLAALIISLVIPFIIKKCPFIRNYTTVYGIVGIAMLTLVFTFGKSVNGSKLSYHLFGLTFQPSEFVKILFIFFVAGMLYENAKLPKLVVTAAISAVIVLLLALSKDLGSALLYYVVFIAMIFVATGKIRYSILGLGAGAAAAYFGYTMFPHVQTRIQIWLDPWMDIDNKGYQLTQSLFAIGTGGWMGMGLGKGQPTTIPLVEEDSRLCIVRAVTTKCRNGNTRFTKLIDTGVIASLDYLRDSIISMHTNKYKNKVIHALLADAINEDNKQVCRDLEAVKILRFIAEYDDQFITEESTSEPGRMLCQIPAPVVPGLNQIYSTIDLYL